MDSNQLDHHRPGPYDNMTSEFNLAVQFLGVRKTSVGLVSAVGNRMVQNFQFNVVSVPWHLQNRLIDCPGELHHIISYHIKNLLVPPLRNKRPWVHYIHSKHYKTVDCVICDSILQSTSAVQCTHLRWKTSILNFICPFV